MREVSVLMNTNIRKVTQEKLIVLFPHLILGKVRKKVEYGSKKIFYTGKHILINKKLFGSIFSQKCPLT